MLVIYEEKNTKMYVINCKYLHECGTLTMKNVHNACVKYQARKNKCN